MLKAISAIDSFIQRCVDEAAFAVMRALNVRKAFVAYLLYSFVAAAPIVECLVGSSHGLAAAVSKLVIAALWFWYARWRLRRDEAADKAGMLSIADMQFGWVKCMWTGLLSTSLVRGEWGGVAQDGLLLVSEYLCGTPKEPPPSKKRETVVGAVTEGV